MPVTIYHNPRCNTSRKTLALLRDKGIEPEVVEYLKTPYTAAQLKQLLAQLKLPAKAVVRKKEAAAAGCYFLATCLPRNSRISLAMVSPSVSRAKCPASSRW